MEAPVLALIPSGVKAGKVYSVLPNNSNGDFTFTRASEGTRIDENGLIDVQGSGIPRLDWGDGECPSLLLEPQRTNEIIWSENFTQWVKSNLTVSSGQITSPDGGLNSYKILETAVNNFHLTYSNVITYPNAITYSYSVFVKKLGRQYVGVQTLVNTAQGQQYAGAVALFDLDTGSVAYTFQHGGHTVANAKIENYGNDWYRISAVFTSGAGQFFALGLVTADSLWLSGTAYNNPYLGDVNKGVYAFGAQGEAGIYASSYIGTKGAAVTRLIDNSHLLNQTLFTDYPFTVYAKAKIDAVGNTVFGLNNTSSNQYYLLFYFPNSSQVSVGRATIGFNDFDNYNFSYSVGDTIKVIIAFISEIEYKLYINGNEIAHVTNGTSIPFNHDDISLGQLRITGDTGTRNSINELRVYNRVLTEAEAIELTTL